MQDSAPGLSVSQVATAMEAPKNLQQAVYGEHPLLWQMTDAERCALLTLVSRIQPKRAIEIGTSEGGSLSAISQYAQQVFTLDIDPTCKQRFGALYSNATFVTGRSQVTLSPLLEELQAQDATDPLEFVLIDGEHTQKAVARDIENVLAYVPRHKPLYILLHDSFKPGMS